MIFALALIPIMVAVGAAIDYNRALSVRARLVSALDAGVLAVGSQANLSDTDATDTVQTWLDVHMPSSSASGWALDSIIQEPDGTIAARASATLPLAFGPFLGRDTLTVTAVTEAKRALDKIELVMVLDNTGSMRGTNLVNLKRAANTLVDTLIHSTANPQDLRVGLVPYTMTVNVGPQHRNASWISGSMPSQYGPDIFNTAGTDRFRLFNQMGVSWAGCVEARPYPYDVTEAPPTQGRPATLYVPFFAPDEPDTISGQSCNGPGYCNNYLPDLVSDANWRIRQGNENKYVSPPRTGASPIGYQFGPNAGCEIQPLTRLTSNTSNFKSAINAMVAGGDTDIKAGVMWGWHVLSPNAPFGDGVAYDNREWTKIMILMTDGQNHNVVVRNNNESVYSGIGYIWQNRIGMTSGNLNRRIDRLDQRLAEACANAKEAGIVIYAVVLRDRSVDQSTVRNCASSPDKVFDVENASGLTAAFQNIGGSIQQLRLSR
ncbi:pilus assembly protein TadG-related protein [Oceaniradius stylonematis]|jgi:Flp pilus assembly protein TadG|uniref:pilus assembly protein TadG-related protein n=1 Tax=Oceaniradius stylonematis TaxID=2184161 RepID=UPI00273FAF3D|nr:pilus assembly protein TadG-related protein [Oceaniradius stylonematis]